ncbi:MAG: 50S ribosomal protein L25 [Bacteroidales bacterium]|nr:50S ribosomal protein L25 [Bacteroidales bacterium]
MKTVSMSGAPRAHVGKKDAKKNRREGKIPCVLYGGKEQIHFTLDESDFKPIIFTPEVFILKIEIDGTEHTAILQDIQYHPVTDSILHADFLEVIDGKPVVIGVPLKFTGNAPGVIKGGKLRKKIRKLTVRGMVDDLPDFIEISINKLDLNDNVKVKDVSYPNLEFLDTPTSEIVGVKTGRGAGMDVPLDEDEEGGEAAEGGETSEGAEGGEGAAEGTEESTAE